MMYYCDLHMHSTASDGQYKPAELVRLAKEKGLQVIALTDHDTIGGLDEAMVEGERQGIRVIPGVEMSAKEYHTFHLLGYAFSPERMRGKQSFQNLGPARAERKVRIMEYLRSKGVDFPLSEVDALVQAGVVGRPHFARVMLARGICKTWEEVFDNYLDTDEFHAVVESKPPVRECIDTIKGAGGIVSMAHPYQTGLDGDDLEALVRNMKDWGLDAIECWHNGHTQERISFYLSLAKKYDLYVTGGSDYHGEKIKEHIHMTKLALDLDWVEGHFGSWE